MTRVIPRFLIASVIALVDIPRAVQAQPALGTHFDTILGPFNTEFLVSEGVGLGEEVVRALAPTAAGIQAAIANEIASLAISAAGTQYFFGPDRTFYVSGNLGSFYMEPPWTSGQGSWSVGLNVTALEFDAFNGKQLDDLFDFLYSGSVEIGGVEYPFAYKYESNYKLWGRLYALSGTYGITDHCDIGFVAPYVKLTGKGDWSHMSRDDGAWVPSSFYPEGLADFRESVEGISDIILRLKYEVVEVEDLNSLTTWSVGADVKLPTGDEDKLLGTGGWGYRLRNLLGKRFGRVYPTLEVAYYWAGVNAIEEVRTVDNIGRPITIDTGIDDNDFDAFEFKVAVPVNLFEERWTISAEYLLRRYNRCGPNRTAVDLGVSSRLKVSDSFFLQGGIRIPQDENGLRPEVIPTIGGEIRF